MTGAGSGIGKAVAVELAARGAAAVVAVDQSKAVLDTAQAVNNARYDLVADAYVGDVTDEAFRRQVFDETIALRGLPTICVPAAGITRDNLAVKLDKETGKPSLYSLDHFRLVLEVNLVAPIYWAMETVGRIAESRKASGLKRWEPQEDMQGAVVFIGSVSSQGNKGQVSYSATKSGLVGAASTLTKEAIYHGVRCAVIHPGFTDTPMVQALGEEYISKSVLPATQLRRLIKVEEIADAVCFLITNSAVSGELWADAGWHPAA